MAKIIDVSIGVWHPSCLIVCITYVPRATKPWLFHSIINSRLRLHFHQFYSGPEFPGRYFQAPHSGKMLLKERVPRLLSLRKAADHCPSLMSHSVHHTRFNVLRSPAAYSFNKHLLMHLLCARHWPQNGEEGDKVPIRMKLIFFFKWGMVNPPPFPKFAMGCCFCIPPQQSVGTLCETLFQSLYWQYSFIFPESLPKLISSFCTTVNFTHFVNHLSKNF